MIAASKPNRILTVTRLTLWLILWLSIFPSTGLLAKNFSTVVVDPGHGGSDKGSNWHGVYEKKLSLDLAIRVQRMLKAKGVPAVLTRSSDKDVSLDERAGIANRQQHFIFVSLHFNGHRNTSYTGIESFYYPGSAKGRRLAGKIQHELGKRIHTKNRGIKPARLKVLRLTKGPAVLIECGFLSNGWERDRCNAAWLREIIAEEIVEGIMAYQ